ncbi:hypothetical protein L484_028097 [Morus notabilis]|uniref:Rhamnogalacturonase A/B/Epimerase-like pectate lyase domain-containing protein n=1 Tax=Morus notabilis TaxID=981085 RepID=W9S7Y1_9ROSA|nr:hypothetical protein L484_028097 [Morus notabilis]
MARRGRILLYLHLFPLFSLVQSLSDTSPTFLVTNFGATGDGRHYDTAAIQSAIDACPARTACLVSFPPGTFLTATIHLKSGIVLDVREGATILGGARIEDYPGERSRWYVVLAENASDVGITGGGAVDGQGLAFVERFDERKNVMVSWNRTGACSGDECRPRLVGFVGCRNVRVWNVTFTKPAYWWSVLASLYLSISILRRKIASVVDLFGMKPNWLPEMVVVALNLLSISFS